MRNSLIYIHYEPFSGLFLTAGISADDVLSATPQPFRHLLILPPVDPEGFVDPHTGFNEISGAEAVTAFLHSKAARVRGWLDYRHGAYLREMTPTEIAELLYLAHAKRHIQPPYYYKLQNQLVFLPLKNDMVTLYFRHARLFDATLAAAISRHLRLAANEQPFWLRLRAQDFVPVPQALLRTLHQPFEDGVVLDFAGGIFSKTAVRVPLLQESARFFPDQEDAISAQRQVGELVLDRTANEWRLDQ